ncbi:hypothetical protein [Bradyrhizobium sp. AZCC 2230]|uniref:hypothetical protein n=1 Tax=Bradyrhizobium sp. AZCC 2230 TaxID=3117021 RepID=UPI002FF3AC1D
MSDETIDGIREFRWPFRNPLDLVAELYCACKWQIGDEEAATFATNYLFEELRLRLGQEEAKRIFLKTASVETKFADDHDDRMLLTRLYLMRDRRTGKRGPIFDALARAIAQENEAFNKSPDRDGRPAKPTNQPSIRKQLKRLDDRDGAAFRAEMGIPSPASPKKKIAKKQAGRRAAAAPKPQRPQR